jgi:hypothetical protein
MEMAPERGWILGLEAVPMLVKAKTRSAGARGRTHEHHKSPDLITPVATPNAPPRGQLGALPSEPAR